MLTRLGFGSFALQPPIRREQTLAEALRGPFLRQNPRRGDPRQGFCDVDGVLYVNTSPWVGDKTP
jgi:hypothetical protein